MPPNPPPPRTARTSRTRRCPSAEDGFTLGQEALEFLVPHFHPRHFPAGTFLWHEGDPANLMVLVDQGRIRAFRDLPSGKRVTLLLFGPGSILGFAPFFDGGGYPATTQTMEEVEARVMDRTDLLRALDNKQVVLTLFALFAGRLRESFRTIEQLSSRGAALRVSAALLALVPESPGPGGLRFLELPTTAVGFSGALGLAPETFSRVMARLVKAGILHRLGARRYQVLDLDRLRLEAGELA